MVGVVLIDTFAAGIQATTITSDPCQILCARINLPGSGVVVAFMKKLDHETDHSRFVVMKRYSALGSLLPKSCCASKVFRVGSNDVQIESIAISPAGYSEVGFHDSKV